MSPNMELLICSIILILGIGIASCALFFATESYFNFQRKLWKLNAAWTLYLLHMLRTDKNID